MVKRIDMDEQDGQGGSNHCLLFFILCFFQKLNDEPGYGMMLDEGGSHVNSGFMF
ncbi:MAG TPA: hypothetical protein VFE47_16345 [Tepidisphaeraceae bacterium]|jgi:hypothetical protein|nr:hypothetical protein [Tepidisphaeraceae bacterium]